MCCGEREIKAPLGPDEKDRKCTDLLLLLLFIAFNAGMLTLMGYSFAEGDYRCVTNGLNYKGRVCGTTLHVDPESQYCVDGGGEALPSLSVMSFSYANYSKGTPLARLPVLIACSAECVEVANGTEAGEKEKGRPAYEGLFLFCTDKRGVAMWGRGATLDEQEDYLKSQRNCSSDEILGAYRGSNLFGYCFPSGNDGNDAFVSNVKTSSLGSQWTQTLASIDNAKWVILAASFAALAIGFLYLFSLKWCAGPLTWTAVFLIEAFLLLGGVFMLYQANKLKAAYGGSDAYQDDPSWGFSYYTAIVLFVLAGLYLCLIVFLCRRIILALDMVKHASNLLYDTPYIVVLPVLAILAGMGFTALWSVTAVYLYSTGKLVKHENDLVPGASYYEFQLSDDTRYALLYHLFGFFWITQFLIALVEITISFVVVRWFFAPRDGSTNAKVIPPWPVLTAYQTVNKFHLGSIAFGSLIIAIIKTIRAMIEYVRQRLRKSNQDSQLVRWLLCLCACYFWCLDKFMQFINKNAYTVIAITKKGFCGASWEAFSMIVANAVRVATLNAVSTIFLGFGKWFVALAGTAVAYLAITNDPALSDPTSPTAVASPFFPCLIVFAISYAAGAMLMSVYDVTIDAMLLCFLYDEKYNILDATTKADVGVHIKALADQCNEQLGNDAHGFSQEEQEAAQKRTGIKGKDTQRGYVAPSAAYQE